jgi:hypothetical protein
MRIVLVLSAAIALGACSAASEGPQPSGTERDLAPAATPEQPNRSSNFPEVETSRATKPDADDFIVIDFVRRDPHTQAHLDALRRGGSTAIIGDPGESYGGIGMSYDPELRRMDLKVGRDGNLHRVGPDARSPGDPDEGPIVDWDELHRKQFGR